MLFLITKATWGGAQRYVYDLATHLPPEKFAPSVAYGMHGKLAEILADKNIPICPIPALNRNVALFSDIASFFQIVKLLKKVRPDVLHLNSSKAAALGALAARLCGVKRIIFTAHGWPFKENRNPTARAAIYFISWLTALLSHTTIVVSKTDEDLGKKMLFVSRKIHYIPLGIETPQFLPREDASRSLSITTPSPRIITIAELTRNKGLSYALEAIAHLKKQGLDVSYFIVGEGEDRADLIERVRELQVQDRVFFLGAIPSAATYLNAFDIFLLPSIKEGMPYVLLEAASAGLPIIATRVVDPPFAEQYPLCEIVAPADPRALASAIDRVRAVYTERRESLPSRLNDMITSTTAVY